VRAQLRTRCSASVAARCASAAASCAAVARVRASLASSSACVCSRCARCSASSIDASCDSAAVARPRQKATCSPSSRVLAVSTSSCMLTFLYRDSAADREYATGQFATRCVSAASIAEHGDARRRAPLRLLASRSFLSMDASSSLSARASRSAWSSARWRSAAATELAMLSSSCGRGRRKNTRGRGSPAAHTVSGTATGSRCGPGAARTRRSWRSLAISSRRAASARCSRTSMSTWSTERTNCSSLAAARPALAQATSATRP